MTQADHADDAGADLARSRELRRIDRGKRNNRRLGWMLALIAATIFVASMLAQS